MIVTSLAPNHKNKEVQLKTIESWKRTGHKIISVNHESEIEWLKDYDIQFVEPKKTGYQLFGKHYIPISEIINLIKSEGSGIVLNSDIILSGLPELGIDPLIFSRYDYDVETKGATLFKSGFDGFYLTKEHCELLPESSLCLGQCHWDYWLPIMLISKGFKLKRPSHPYLFHKKHQLQYNLDMWRKTAEIFRNETGIHGTNQQASNFAYATINKNIISI